MNWSRGFFRLWAVFSALWFAGFMIAMVIEWPKDAADLSDLERANRVTIFQHVEAFILGATIPPVAILIVGGAVGWAVSGFRR